jgi:hypothetical protein
METIFCRATNLSRSKTAGRASVTGRTVSTVLLAMAESLRDQKHNSGGQKRVGRNPGSEKTVSWNAFSIKAKAVAAGLPEAVGRLGLAGWPARKQGSLSCPAVIW